MKNIFKITTLFAAVLMLFCLTGCGDTAGGTPSTPAEPTMQETPLTLEAIESGTITLTNPWSTLKYKKNGSDFVNVTASANTIAVAAGDKVAFYANGSQNTASTYLKILCSADCFVYGNVMSLLNLSDFKNATSISTEYAFANLFYENTHIKNHAQKALVLPATTLAANCYYSMFCGCTGLTSAPALPATTLADCCYLSMFYGCTALTSAPALPATILGEYCYEYMFFGCTSLTSAPALPATEMYDGCYSYMFAGCTRLTSAPLLPATDLVAGCYSNMFNGCTSLASAPALPATALAASCCSSMFSGCTELTSAPALPATTLANDCYSSMFDGCTSLTSAPVLPAMTLARSCYSYMFRDCTGLMIAPTLPATDLVASCYFSMFDGCTSLSSVTCLATNIPARDCTENWLYNVASSGTFTKASSMTSWTRDASGIPDGWTVQNYSAPQQ